ncbi:carbohydrate ABC transporter permease [Micromonospora carbonacea]|uniref:carbohydrate ABC transporter permease n=1 Tax=Micromonospora carbonacea TaxID=47853 RepID=UPI00182288EA|nr:sugar ABC transporter permease [Micromonospora carbonacea]MBB5826323.1 multiple sugar transport system permease protein [Micromonospora carbonacea]
MTQAPPRPRAGRSRNRARLRTLGTAGLFLLPALTGLVFLRLVPSVEAVTSAVTNRLGEFSLTNFTYLFGDPAFLGSLKVTLLFSLVINPFQIAVALFLAVLLTRHIPLVGLWRTLILLPIAIPQTVSAIVWGVLFRPDGPLNGLLGTLGIPAVPWLVSPDTALMSIVILCSWVGVGYWMTFLVAGIHEIPRSLYEASDLDGAGGWKQFVHITLPGIRRPLLFVLVADTVANFLVFAPVRILTQGGPEGSTNLIMNFIFERAYTLADTGSSAAATVVLVSIVIVVVAAQFRLLPGKD